MATVFNFRCTQDTQAGSDLVINVTQESFPTQLQVACISGSIEIQGSTGEILGLPVSPIILTSGQSINFNEWSYREITITIKDGTEYQILANE